MFAKISLNENVQTGKRGGENSLKMQAHNSIGCEDWQQKFISLQRNDYVKKNVNDFFNNKVR